jgi:hypothetical protein
MFIDSDIAFNPKDVLALMALQTEESEFDVISASYPKKCITWEKIKAAVDKGFADENPKQLEQFVGSHFGDSNCHVDSSISTHYVPSYNISPGKYLPVIIRNRKDQNGGHSDDYVELLACKWGLVPNFTSKTAEKVDHFKMFNCRSEEMQNKPSFKHLISRNRCIVLTEGFYEWKSQHFGEKQPYFVHFKSQNQKLRRFRNCLPEKLRIWDNLLSKSAILVTCRAWLGLSSPNWMMFPSRLLSNFNTMDASPTPRSGKSLGFQKRR